MEELSGKKWKDAVGTMVPFCWYYRSDPSGACAAMLAVFASSRASSASGRDTA